MTGPEHYQAAEALLNQARSEESEIFAGLVAAAQVHATLALAAATAINDPDPTGTGQPSWAADEWATVAYPGPDPD